VFDLILSKELFCKCVIRVAECVRMVKDLWFLCGCVAYRTIFTAFYVLRLTSYILILIIGDWNAFIKNSARYFFKFAKTSYIRSRVLTSTKT